MLIVSTNQDFCIISYNRFKLWSFFNSQSSWRTTGTYLIICSFVTQNWWYSKFYTVKKNLDIKYQMSSVTSSHIQCNKGHMGHIAWLSFQERLAYLISLTSHRTSLISATHNFRFSYGGFNSSLSRLNVSHSGRHFKCIFFKKIDKFPNQISLKFVPMSPIDNKPALVHVIDWCRPGEKPLSEPMIVSLQTYICVTRPQWVNGGLSEGLIAPIYIIGAGVTCLVLSYLHCRQGNI